MQTSLPFILLILALATPAAEPALNNGAMEGTPVDHTNGEGKLVTPPGWTPVNQNADRGDRLAVEASDRPGGGQCLHVHTFGSDAGVYQTLPPLIQGRTYLVTAWVKRLSGTLSVKAYPLNWGPAVMRRLDNQSTGWTQLTVGLTPVDKGAHIYLVADPEADFLIDDVQIREAPLQVGTPELLPYAITPRWRYRVPVLAATDTGVPADVQIQAVVDLGGGPGLAPPQTVTLQPGATTPVMVEIPLSAEGRFYIEARHPDTGEILGGSSLVTALGSPWVVRYPYKDSLYASSGYAWPLRLDVLSAHATTVASLRVIATITDPAGQVLREATGALVNGTIVVPLDGVGLAPGSYRLQVLVREAEGRSVHQAERPLHIRPAVPNDVVVGPDGDTLVNGKPFYPIGLYWVLADPAGWKPGPARQTADLLDLKQSGFNTLHTYAFEHNDVNDTDANALDYLDMAQELGFKVMLGLRRDWYQGTELNQAAIEKRVQQLRDHPALLCWTLWDEPDFNLANVPRVQAVYDIVNRLDPFHPAMPVFMSGGGRPFRAATDINLLDCYPGAGNADLLPAVFVRTRAAIPDKPLWYVAQAYQQGDKLPSETDMRLYWKYALEADAKAIFWYSYGGDGKAWDSIRIPPEHYAAVKRAVRALADTVEAR